MSLLHRSESMLREIMVPLDGSPFAEQAIPLALGLASRDRATIHLIHIVESSESGAPALASHDQDYPGALAASLEREFGIPIVTEQRGGEVIDQLVDYAGEAAVDLVVLATHGWGGLARLWLGSTTDALLRRLELPILTVRPQEEESNSGGGLPPIGELPEHILVPLDGSQLAESVLDTAVEVGGSDLRISLLTVIPGPIPNDPVSISYALTRSQPVLEEERSLALSYLEEVADRLVERVRRVDTVALTEPETVRSILDYADQNEVDLIAITTGGRGGIRRLALGSVADEILRRAGVPVLVFRRSRP